MTQTVTLQDVVAAVPATVADFCLIVPLLAAPGPPACCSLPCRGAARQRFVSDSLELLAHPRGFSPAAVQCTGTFGAARAHDDAVAVARAPARTPDDHAKPKTEPSDPGPRSGLQAQVLV